MPDFCSCGAQLPPDALFCHKCGKPQRDLVQPEIEANTYPSAPPSPVVVNVASPPPRPQPLPLNFHNPIAVRIALVAAVCATMLGFLVFVNWLAAGFFAVYLYSRKTGSQLDPLAGVRMGWMTGVVTYVFATIALTVQQLPDVLSGHPFRTAIEGMRNSPFQDPSVSRMLQTQPGAAILLFLILLFVLVTCLSMAGGALGAKLVGSPKQS
jgi:hypothetical protein